MHFEEKELPIPLTDQQRADLEIRNTEIDVALSVAEEDLAKARLAYKEMTAEIRKEKKENLRTYRSGVKMQRVNEMEYVNEDEATLEYYDESNDLIHSRALTMDERRQYRIAFNKRPDKAKVTDN